MAYTLWYDTKLKLKDGGDEQQTMTEQHRNRTAP
jgi:hypothetical protein